MDIVNVESDSATPNRYSSRSSSEPTVFRIDCVHCHHPDSEYAAQKKKLIVTGIFCFVFMVAEIVGGIIANSLAVSTDAAHMLSDLAAFMVSLMAIWLSTKPPTAKLNFGFYRAEILGALLSVLILWLLTGILVYMAVQRFINQDYELDAVVMMIVAALGLVVNIIMCFMLAFSGDLSKPCEFKLTMNLRTAFLHVLGDLLQSVAVLIAAGIVLVNPNYKEADPICTFIFSVVILISTLNTMKDIIRVLMEGVPKGVDLNDIRQTIVNIPGVVEVYNLRVWALTLEKVALSAHIAIEKGIDAMKVLQHTRESLKEKMKFFEITLQIEPFEGSSGACLICEAKKKSEMKDSSEPPRLRETSSLPCLPLSV